MPEKIVTKGLVLRQTQTKEADKILTVLTAEHGKLAVVARGARRKNSKIAAASELLAFSELVLYEQRGWLMPRARPSSCGGTSVRMSNCCRLRRILPN